MCMLLYFYAAVAFLTTSFPSAVSVGTQDAYDDEIYVAKDHLSITRHKRAVGGVAVMQLIKKGAKVIFTGYTHKIYIKGGGTKRALEDFKSIDPFITEKYRDGGKTTTLGKVRGRLVSVTTGDKTSRPILSVQRTILYPKRRTFTDTFLYDE